MRNWRQAYKTRKFLAQKFSTIVSLNCTTKPLTEAKLDIVSVAFNNAELVARQIDLVRKFVKDDFFFTIADNSDDPQKSKLIYNVCEQKCVGYIRLPANPLHGSESHGLALNWIYEHYIKPRKPASFGFLDHDIFPTQEFSIRARLQDFPIYGLLQRREFFWYLWPGFCFFSFDFAHGKKFDFLPKSFATSAGNIRVDTGGGNWLSLYSSLAPQKIYPISQFYGLLQFDASPEEPIKILGDRQETQAQFCFEQLAQKHEFIEFLDSWIHLRKAGYETEAEQKIEKIFSYLASPSFGDLRQQIELSTKRISAKKTMTVIPPIAFVAIVTKKLRKDAVIRTDFSGFREDYLVLHCLLKKYNPKTLMEIGTSSGRGTKVICNALATNNPAKDVKVFSIDVPPNTDPSIIYPQHEDGHPVKAGMDCDLPFVQLFGDSQNFDFRPFYPLEAWFIDGKHSFAFAKNDTVTALLANPKLIIWHDLQIDEVYEAVVEVMSQRTDYDVFWVANSRVGYAIRNDRS
jgi:hypothetical protein